MIFISSIFIYTCIIIYTKLVGLRSFSKISSTDFAITVAIGSLFASTISSSSPSIGIGIVALSCLFLGKWLVSILRKKSEYINSLISNKPLLLMHDGSFIEKNLDRANITKNDIFGKLREANAHRFEDVIAVIFESTGDISVLHSKDKEAYVESEFINNVIDSKYVTKQK